MDDMNLFLALLCCLVGCIGFSMTNNVRGRPLVWASLGGCVALLIYLLTPASLGTAMRSFFGTLGAALYSEWMARTKKAPVTAFLITGLFALVPGAGIYYSMKYAVAGESEQFLQKLLETIGVAGAMALGVILISSLVRLYTGIVQRRFPLSPLKAPGEVHAVIDRPYGSGPVTDTLSVCPFNLGTCQVDDGEFRELLVLGIHAPLTEFTGRKAAMVFFKERKEPLLIAVPFGMLVQEEDVRRAVQELSPGRPFRIRMLLTRPVF